MSRFSPDAVERVKAATDIVEVISAYSDLRRAGQRFSGLCPFHDERTPSFSVNPHDRLYYCFGCEAGGDVFKFVMEKEGLSFPEAVEALADRYGVEIEREQEDPRVEQARQRRRRLHELLDRTASFYAAYLWSASEAEHARHYLEGRGLGEQVLRDFGVGYAPSAWDQVLTRGQRAEFSLEELHAAGLIQRGKQGGHYDRFRARIVFPIRDAKGKTLGFGARALRENQQPKYLNSPEGELYHKSHTLYGIDRARAAIARADEALVVEGYTDVLALHQAGLEGTVAVMGTAITPDQLATLSGLASTVTLAMDADLAGQAAMLRAQGAARDRKMRMRVVRMPVGTDPSDFLQAGSPEDFGKLLAGAVDFPEFQVTATLDRSDLASPAERDRALGEVAPVLAQMGDSIERDELARKVADRLGIGPELLGRMLQQAGQRPAPDRPGARADAAPDRRQVAPPPRRLLTPQERRERALLAMCLASPQAGREYLARLTPEHLSSPPAARARDWLAEHLGSPLQGLPRDDEELVSLITELVMAAEREPAPRHAMELNFLLLEQKLVERQIAEATGRGDDRAGADLARRRAELIESMGSLEMSEG